MTRKETEILLKKVENLEKMVQTMGHKIVSKSQKNNFDPKKAEIGDPISFEITVKVE